MDRPDVENTVIMKWDESADHFAHALQYVYKEKKIDLATKNQMAPQKIEKFLEEVSNDSINFRNSVLFFLNKTYELLVDSCKDIAEGLCYSILLKLEGFIAQNDGFKEQIKDSEVLDEYWIDAFQITSHLKIGKVWSSVDILMHISEPETSKRKDQIDELIRKMVAEKDSFQLSVQWISLFDMKDIKREMFEKVSIFLNIGIKTYFKF